MSPSSSTADVKFFPNGKKGACLAMKPGDDGVGKMISALNVSWNYNWGYYKRECQPSDVQYVPMVWGKSNKQSMKERIDEHVKPLVDDGSCKLLLCINEPDMKKQSNMTVDEVLEMWPLFEELGVPLVSPSCANPLPQTASCTEDECNQGVEGGWMCEFMAKAKKRGYRVDAVGVHWYGGTSVDAFKSQMKSIYKQYKLPLVVTEFATADWKAMKTGNCEDNRFSRQQVLEFMQQVLPWLERCPFVAGYSWFPFLPDCPQGTCSALFNKNNQLTALGRYYKSVTPDNPDGDKSISV